MCVTFNKGLSYFCETDAIINYNVFYHSAREESLSLTLQCYSNCRQRQQFTSRRRASDIDEFEKSDDKPLFPPEKHQASLRSQLRWSHERASLVTRLTDRWNS